MLIYLQTKRIEPGARQKPACREVPAALSLASLEATQDAFQPENEAGEPIAWDALPPLEKGAKEASFWVKNVSGKSARFLGKLKASLDAETTAALVQTRLDVQKDRPPRAKPLSHARARAENEKRIAAAKAEKRAARDAARAENQGE